MFLKIQPAGSALPVCLLQIKSSPSAQVFVIRELRTDHDVGKQSTNKKRQLASTDVLACTRSLKTLSRNIPVLSVVVHRLCPLETCNSAFAAHCLTQTGCFSFQSYVCHWEQNPITISEIHICMKDTEKSVEAFAPVQMLLRLIVGLYH